MNTNHVPREQDGQNSTVIGPSSVGN